MTHRPMELLGHLARWDPNANGTLKHDQLCELLKKLKTVFTCDDEIEGFLERCPDPVFITDFVYWLYSLASVNPVDRRFDDDGFKKATGLQIHGQFAIAWLKVGVARHVARSGGILERRQDLPDGALHYGTPPADVSLFNVSYTRTSESHPDPEAKQLRNLIAILDQEEAMDSDLLFLPYVSFFPRLADNPTARDQELMQYGTLVYLRYLPVLARIRTIWLDAVRDDSIPLVQKGWRAYEVVLASYCQQILHSRHEHVVSHIQQIADPEKMSDLKRYIDSKHFSHPGDKDILLNYLRELLHNITPPSTDVLGFEYFCNHAQLAWLYVGYVKLLARLDGPFPRRQELAEGNYVIGAPSRRGRRFVVSHCWESEVHPSPGGSRMRELVRALARLKAADSDVVFFDFCSNSQDAKMGRKYATDEPFQGAPARDATAHAYFTTNDVETISGRHPQEHRAFKFAMWDMGRLYSYEGCDVIVLPTLAEELEPSRSRLLSTFPDGDAWGLVNTRPYHKRGWCVAEFSIALYCGRIANKEDKNVQSVMASRYWPRTVAEYAHMMKHDEVKFTCKGDRHAVKYSFFKMTFGLGNLQAK